MSNKFSAFFFGFSYTVNRNNLNITVWFAHLTKTALLNGQTQVETFIQGQVSTKIKPITATIHRNKRQNFSSEIICTPSGAIMKVAQMERSGLMALVDPAEGSGMIQLESALEGRGEGLMSAFHSKIYSTWFNVSDC